MDPIDLSLNPQGLIQSLSADGLFLPFSNDEILIRTNHGQLLLSSLPCTRRGDVFTYDGGFVTIVIGYETIASTCFLTRSIHLECHRPTELLYIGSAVPMPGSFLYKSFVNASAAVFGREGEAGTCCGFENPYCSINDRFVGFEPGLILKENEVFDCDLNFYGLYRLSGIMIQPQLHKSEVIRNGRHQTRYRNPSEGIPLDHAEITHFNAYTKAYFGIQSKKFRFGSYNFFSNLPQRPETQAHKDAYFRHIDNFANLGGDTIFLNPLVPNEIPNESPDSCWELFPEGSMAEEILNYAKSKGLKIGMYTGTAGNGSYGNSSMIPFSDVKQWKKVDINGTVSGENCLADDSFTDWYIRVQKNTIEKYGMSVWGWDPGPGNGMFCASAEHGHLPLKGAYKGFRNCLRVMKELKEAFPDLYYLTFHGLKEYGLWGFKYIDQHEAIWENEVYVMAPAFTDLSMDRATADQIRMQSIWNYMFRFMSPALNHGIPHRMIQSCWMNMTELDTLTDHTGWKYGLLSSIAAGGSVTLPILPEDPESIDEYIPFYRKWITWAREHFDYSKNTIPFGAQGGCGIDGFSKLIDNRGYLFLCNPFPVPVEFSFTLDERIGYRKDDSVARLSMLYPLEKSMGNACYGSAVTLTIPEYEILVLQLSDEVPALADSPVAPALPRVLLPDADGKSQFFADSRIKALLEKGKAYVSQRSIDAEAEYCRVWGRFNDCWCRPDRLWVWICLDDLDADRQIVLLCNGKPAELKREILSHNDFRVDTMFFADITDLVSWDRENELCLESSAPGKAVIYLSYLKPWNEELPEHGFVIPNIGENAPVLDKNVKVLSVQLNDDNIMHPMQENTVTAEVNLPPEQLEGVYLTAPISIGNTGFCLKSDMAMVFEDGKWIKRFPADQRIKLIIDDDKLSVWAVTKDLRESESFDLPFNWLL